MPLTVTAGAVSEASVSESEVSWLPAAGFPLKWEIVTAETAAKRKIPAPAAAGEEGIFPSPFQMQAGGFFWGRGRKSGRLCFVCDRNGLSF